MRQHAPETNGPTNTMASKVVFVPDSPTKAFMAGNYVFTRAHADNCAALHKAGVSVWQLRQAFHPNASLEQVVVAIQVGLLIYMDFFNIDELDPKVFDPSIVCLGMWNVGGPNQSNE